MGKNRWPAATQSYKQDYRYWRGSYSVAQSSPKKEHAFPQYDQRRPAHSATEPRRALATADAPSEDTGYVQLLQSGLNSARKAEQKVASLQKAIEAKRNQWAKYLEDMKEAWMKESQRHARNVAQLEEDLDKALRLQDAARAELRNIHHTVLTGQQSRRIADESDMAGTWDAMMGQWQQEGSVAAPEAVLQRALSGLPSTPVPADHGPPPGLAFDPRAFVVPGLGSAPPGPPRPPLASVMPSAGPPPPTPVEEMDVHMNGNESYSAAALHDPYQTSPGAHCVRARTATSPSARVSPYLDPRLESRSDHNPSMAGTAPTAGQVREAPDVASALASNRATTPFGGRFATIRSIDPAGRPTPALIADDDDELSAMPGPEEPGGPA